MGALTVQPTSIIYRLGETGQVSVPLVGKRAAGKVALMDQDDYERAAGITWSVTRAGYAVGHKLLASGWNGSILMHRFVMMAELGEIPDHINRNKLDNRKENLRIVTGALNRANRERKRTSKGHPVFKGIRRRGSGWEARITVGSENVYLGIHPNPESAALVYDQAARKHFGSCACTNFTEGGLQAWAH